MLLAVVVTTLVGRVLGATALGQWSLLVAAGTLLHTILLNWTHAATVRYGHEEWVRTGRFDKTVNARLLLLAGMAAASYAVLFVLPPQWLSNWFATDPSQSWMIVLFALSAWLAAEAQATLQATDRIFWQAAVAPALAVLSSLALALVFLAGSRSLGAAVAAVTAMPILGWGAVWVAVIATTVSAPRFALPELWRHVRFGAPLLPIFLLGYVSDWGDHVLLSRFSSAEQVGFFAVSYQVMVAALAANSVLTTVLLPRLIAQEVERPGAMRRYVAEEVPTFYSLWMIGTVWVIAVLPGTVRSLMGERFDDSIAPLVILLVVIPSSVVTSLYTVLFNVQKRMASLMVYVFLMTVTNVSVSFALIPEFGAVGAAVGTVLSHALSQACYVWDQHRSLSVPAARVWMLWTAGLVLGVMQLVVGEDVGGRLAWALVATAVLAGVVRLAGSIDGQLVRRLFAGPLSPLAGIINRALAAKAST